MKVVSILLLAALLTGCTAVEEVAAEQPATTQEPAATPAPTEGTGGPPVPAAPPVDGAGANPTNPGGATATPEPTATPIPKPTPTPQHIPIASSSSTSKLFLVNNYEFPVIEIETHYEACEDMDFIWYCSTGSPIVCTGNGEQATPPYAGTMQFAAECFTFDGENEYITATIDLGALE